MRWPMQKRRRREQCGALGLQISHLGTKPRPGDRRAAGVIRRCWLMCAEDPARAWVIGDGDPRSQEQRDVLRQIYLSDVVIPRQ
jgi:hypothetical protein